MIKPMNASTRTPQPLWNAKTAASKTVAYPVQDSNLEVNGEHPYTPPIILVTCGHCGKTYNPEQEHHVTTLTTEQPNGKWRWCQWQNRNR
jgi:hypothetical protein